MADEQKAHSNYLDEGKRFLAAQHWSNAATTFARAIKAQPDHPDAYLGLGIALFQLGRYPDAFRIFERGRQLVPDNPAFIERMAEVQELLGFVSDASQLYLEAADLYLTNRHDTMGAIRVWENATRLVPGLLGIHVKLARAYESVGQTRSAVRQYVTLAYNLHQRGEKAKALEVTRRALRLEPTNQQALNTQEAIQSGKALKEPEGDPKAAPPAVLPAAPSVLPDWLRESVPAAPVPDELLDLDPMAWLDSMEPAEAVAAEPEDIPDWLSGIVPKTPESDELPDWLSSIETVEAETAAPANLLNMRPETPSIDEVTDNDVQFSAYYPRSVLPDVRYGLIVYAHIQGSLPAIEQDVKKFREDLGGTIPAPKTAKQSAQLKLGAPLTIVPECEDLEFSPQSITKKWDAPWMRFDFDFKPKQSLIGETLFVRLSIQISGIEIAHIKLSIEVVPELRYKVSESFRNALAAAKLSSQTTTMYQKIFISYSRQDKEIVEAYRLALLARGDDVFMDTYSIPVGAGWQAALARAIDSADIFQLFWSPNAANSPNVRDEWDYALKYRCPETRCEGFIRPVFWVNPLPVKPPDELAHLNFRFVSLRPLQNNVSF